MVFHTAAELPILQVQAVASKTVTRSWELAEPRRLELKAYLSYIVGGLVGLLAAFLLSALLSINGTPQLILFGILPALGGALGDRFAQRSSRKP